MGRIIRPGSEEYNKLTTMYASKGKKFKYGTVKAKDRPELQQIPETPKTQEQTKQQIEPGTSFKAPISKKYQEQLDEERQSRQAPQFNEEQEPESLPAYLGRNISKFPYQLYKAGRTGMGIGDIMQTLGLNAQGQKNPFITTTEEAQKEFGSVMPKSMYETRPGDEPMEFLTGEAPFWALGGVQGGLKGIGKSILTSLGMAGGARAGEWAGQQAGKLTSNEQEKKELELLGLLAGGHGGGRAGAYTGAILENLPSKLLPKMEEEAAYGKVQKAHEQLNQRKEEFKKREKGLAKQYTPEDLEKSVKHRETILNGSISEQQFEANKDQLLHEIGQEKIDYDQTIADMPKLYSPLYKEAEALENPGKFDASNVLNAANEAIKSTKKGAVSSTGTVVKKVVNDITRLTKGKKVKNKTTGKIENQPPTMTIADAKEIKRNINEARFNKEPGSQSHILGEITKALNEFIYGNNDPEHNQKYREAEGLVVKRAEMNEGRDLFRDQMALEKEKLNRSKYHIATETGRKESVSKIEKVAEGLKRTITPIAAGALGSALGYMGFSKAGAILGGLGYATSEIAHQIKIANKLFEKYPHMKDRYINTIKESAKKDIPTLTLRVNQLSKAMDKLAEKEGYDYPEVELKRY